jgi:hypothetical protein
VNNRSSISLRGTVLLTAWVLLGIALAGSARADTNHEFWPELDIWARLTDSLRLLFITSGTRDRNGDRTADEGEAFLDYRMSDRISFRAGFDYQKNLPAGTSTSDSIEHRYVFDFNYRWRIGEAGRLTDRSRLDIRDIEDDTSYRIRNRLLYEQDIKVSRTTITPYASLEAYYDSRSSTVSRYRVESGTVVPFGRRFEGDFYLGWQRDTHPGTERVVGLGFTLTARF